MVKLQFAKQGEGDKGTMNFEEFANILTSRSSKYDK